MKYILCPEYVVSQSDGDLHYIGTAQLARLYGLRPHEWIDGSDLRGRDTTGMIHLHPRTDGNYTLER